MFTTQLHKWKGEKSIIMPNSTSKDTDKASPMIKLKDVNIPVLFNQMLPKLDQQNR